MIFPGVVFASAMLIDVRVCLAVAAPFLRLVVISALASTFVCLVTGFAARETISTLVLSRVVVGVIGHSHHLFIAGIVSPCLVVFPPVSWVVIVVGVASLGCTSFLVLLINFAKSRLSPLA